jgi:hypothetical protein
VLKDNFRTFTVAPTNAICRHFGAATGGLFHWFHDPSPAGTALWIALDHRVSVLEAETYALTTHEDWTMPVHSLSH